MVANQTLAAASAIFAWAATQEIVAVNPCRGVERNATRSRERVLADGEVPQFWAAFDDAGLVVSSALKMILLTGQRPGEVAHMRREHIDDGWWKMPGEPVPALGWPGTKNEQTPQGVAAQRRRGHCWRNWVTKPPASSSLGHAVVRARCRHARDLLQPQGRRKATPHDLRRTFSARVTALGFGRDAMNRITNHKEGGIADVYDRHEYAEENMRIMETVAAHIMALVEGQPDDKVVPLRR